MKYRKMKCRSQEVKGKGIIENPHVEEGVIQGLTILFPTSYRVISGTMTTSFYLQGDISGHIKVEYRENRYRITFTDSYAYFETLNLAGRMELTKSPKIGRASCRERV